MIMMIVMLIVFVMSSIVGGGARIQFVGVVLQDGAYELGEVRPFGDGAT